jgi:hypothetical protein
MVFDDLPEPNLRYQNIFSPPPSKVEYEGDRIVGTTMQGDRVIIPGAFAD